jgi:hypothetical protein
MKRGELDAVPVDLADVEVCADGGDVCGGDVVCGAPDAFGGGVLCMISLHSHITSHIRGLKFECQGTTGEGGREMDW